MMNRMTPMNVSEGEENAATKTTKLARKLSHLKSKSTVIYF